MARESRVEGRGRELFEAVCRLDLEGIVPKRKADRYAPETVWYKLENRADGGSLGGVRPAPSVTNGDTPALRRETCSTPEDSLGRSIVGFLGLALRFYGRYFAAVVALGLVVALAIWLTSSAARWWKEP